MIPLMRPELPSPELVDIFFSRSVQMGKLANFGPSFDAVTRIGKEKFGSYVLPVSNGTDAITVACKTSLIPGSRVVLPDYTHIGTFSGVKNAGFVPIFSKANPLTWTLCLETLSEHVDAFDAMVVVSPFGYKVAIGEYERFARAHNKRIIYDFAGAYGNFPQTRDQTAFPVCYSTHATKTVNTGEGGMVFFKTLDEYHRAKRLISFDIEDGYPKSTDGSNYKMDEYRCAQLAAIFISGSSFANRIHRRRNVLSKYFRHLHPERHPHAWTSEHYPSMAVIPGLTFIAGLSGFEYKRYYPILSRITSFQGIERFSESDFDAFYNNWALPIDVTDAEQDYIIGKITGEITSG